MLRELVVEGLAVIEHASIELGPGFTVLTGETGAGKSLVADALALALGARADSGLVRTGAPKATVALVADLSQCPRAAAACAEHGIELEEGRLVLAREISADGRSSARANGRPTTLMALKAVGAEMVDLHGQHQHQALLDPSRQIEFFDDWLGEPQLRGDVSVAWSEYDALRRKLESLQLGAVERERTISLLRFQVEEITAVSPSPGEAASLKASLHRGQNASVLFEAISGAIESLSDQEGSAMDLLARESKRLEARCGDASGLETAVTQLADAEESVRQAVATLRAERNSIEADPHALEAMAERLEAVLHLCRKFGTDEDGVIRRHEEMRAELAVLEGAEENAAGLEGDLIAAEERLQTSCAALTAARSRGAACFSKMVTDMVRDLAMSEARFEVRIEPTQSSATGADSVQFFFCANPGEAEQPMARVASGGEASRLMLAVKAVSAGRAGVPTMVFDEIDSGLSGRAAVSTGAALQAMAKDRQILAISHLAQIAGRADTHLSVSKHVAQGRTTTVITELRGEERVAEIARLVGGEEIGASAIANARELIVPSLF
ncbi:MAG: DNA repair protein RecN [Fimbriimonadaceae bacterium]|nr:DNA repair protein RecN [Fimbriimonadaceae bacterium]